MVKLIAFITLIILSVSPLFAQAQGVSQSRVPQAVTEAEVRACLNEYMDAYMKRDLDRFMALFSKDAVENRTYPYNDIYQGYGMQFRVSEALNYQLTIFYIKTYARSAYVSGRYVMKQTFKRWDGSRVYEGDIQFNLVRENATLKIKEINYGMSR